MKYVNNQFPKFLLLIFIAGLTCLPPGTAHAQTDFFSIRGYVKELGQFSIDNSFSTIRYDNILHNRIETDWSIGKNLDLSADLRTRLLQGYTIDNTPNLTDFYENDPNFLDLSWVWFESDRAIMHSSIDRLYLSYISGPYEIHAGRQRINWGRTYVWNPTDLFNNFAFLDFDYEERPGVDALLFQYNWSYASGIELGFQMGDNFNEMVLAGMYRDSWGTYDIQLIGAHYLDFVTLGLGWAGYLKGAGFKGEVSYFHPEDHFFDDFGTVTATAGIDYMFPNSLYVQTEFLYNGGFNRESDPFGELIRPPAANNLYIAETGWFVNGSYPAHPLVNVSLGFLTSFDRSIFIPIPQVSVSVKENLDLLVISQLLKGNVFNPVLETPNLVFIRLKWSF